jgi:hypothetical protein
MAGAIRRVPAIADAGINRLINGPEGFTPDNEFILGESDVRGFFVAAGFCAHGIAGAGGIGQQMAQWIVAGEPELDLWKMDIRRFGAHYRSRAYTLARTTEVYATYYDIHYPNEERQGGRPLRLSPAYEELVALGAEFGEKGGWERPNWFTSNKAGGSERLRPRGWAGQHWSPAIGAEALATRQTAALFDESSFAKIEIEGDGALAFLQRLCANDVNRAVGSITYTQMLNRRGGIECDFTVTRLAADRTTASRRVLAGLFHTAYLYACKIRGCTHAVIEVNPRHVLFYGKELKFDLIGSERLDPRVNAPAVLLCVAFETIAESLWKNAGKHPAPGTKRTLFHYGFAPKEERGVLHRLNALVARGWRVQ